MQFKTENDDTLKKLVAQEKRFMEKLKAAKKQVAAREAELKKKRALVLGTMLLAEIEENSQILEVIAPLIEKHVKTARDKKLVAIEGLKKKEPASANQSSI